MLLGDSHWDMFRRCELRRGTQPPRDVGDHLFDPLGQQLVLLVGAQSPLHRAGDLAEIADVRQMMETSRDKLRDRYTDDISNLNGDVADLRQEKLQLKSKLDELSEIIDETRVKPKDPATLVDGTGGLSGWRSSVPTSVIGVSDDLKVTPPATHDASLSTVVVEELQRAGWTITPHGNDAEQRIVVLAATPMGWKGHSGPSAGVVHETKVYLF